MFTGTSAARLACHLMEEKAMGVMARHFPGMICAITHNRKTNALDDSSTHT